MRQFGLFLIVALLLNVPVLAVAQDEAPAAEQAVEPGTEPTSEAETEPAADPTAEPAAGPAETALPAEASDAARDAARRCDEGDMAFCLDLATMYLNGSGVPMDSERADELFATAEARLMAQCEAEGGAACDLYRDNFGDTPGE